MTKPWWLVGLLCLSACTGLSYSGQTVADAVLQNDVGRDVQKYFRMATGCGRAEQIQMRPQGAEITANGRIIEVREVWQVRGCGRSMDFPVRMRPDARGETDYSITVRSSP